jgi:hypothetical protein
MMTMAVLYLGISQREFFRCGVVFMNTRACQGLYTQSWKELYEAAMCELDVNKLPQRISEAESAVMRARELSCASGEGFDEQESLDDAMCVLNALRGSLKRRPSGIQSTTSLDCLKGA